MLDVDSVQAFVAIADNKSFTRAANELGSTQGAISVKLKRLEENVGTVEIELTRDGLRDIESVASQIEVQGARYPEHLEQMTGR